MVTLIFLLMGGACLAIGSAISGMDNFWGSFLVNASSSALVLAVVIFLIEGPLLTREGRRQIVISQNARSTLKVFEDVSSTTARQLARWLALGSGVNLYGEEQKDPKAFRALLLAVFDQAADVTPQSLPQSRSLSEEEYLDWIRSFMDFVDRIRSRTQGDYEVQAMLYKVMAVLDDFDRSVSRSLFPPTVRNQVMRQRSLGRLGRQLVEFDEAITVVTSTHPSLRKATIYAESS